MQKPNFILFVFDSLRFDHIGSQKDQQSLTPNLDQIATQSFVFNQAYGHGTSTRTSMSAMLSSTYPMMYGGPKSLSADRPVIQEFLRNAGYTTAAVSSNLYMSSNYGWNRGFEYFNECHPQQVYHRKLGLRIKNKILKWLGKNLSTPTILPAEFLLAEARGFLQRHRKPFYLWLHFMDTHWPYFHQTYSWDENQSRRQDEMRRKQKRLLQAVPDLKPGELQMIHNEYSLSVQRLDAQIGLFVNWLRKRGTLENTWLVFTADHGEEFYEHEGMSHTGYLPYDTLIHVPLIIRPAASFGKMTGCQINQQTRLIDIAPTFLELAGIPKNNCILGESLLELMAPRAEIEKERPVFIETHPDIPCFGVRQEGWKYFVRMGDQKAFLFDLDLDPLEQENLAQSHPDLVRRFQDILDGYLRMEANYNRYTPCRGDDLVVDEEMTQRLRNLGYL